MRELRGIGCGSWENVGKVAWGKISQSAIDILEILKKLGLIEYEKVMKKEITGTIKTIYKIDRVRNRIDMN